MTDPKAGLADSTACRRFNLGDGMILIAAIGVGLALGKEAFAETFPRHSIALFTEFYTARGILNAATLMVESLCIAMLLIRLRQPRPSLIRVICQPGTIACCTAGASLPLLLIILIGSGSNGSLSALALSLPLSTGGLVGFIWMVVWRGGYWKREKGWIDGMGYILGVCWPLLLLLQWCMFS